MPEYWRVIISPLTKIQAEAIVSLHNSRKNTEGLVCEAERYNPDAIPV